MKTFICDLCGGEFDDDTPIGEQEAELKFYFGNISKEDCASVCDDCFEEIRPETNLAQYETWRQHEVAQSKQVENN